MGFSSANIFAIFQPLLELTGIICQEKCYLNIATENAPFSRCCNQHEKLCVIGVTGLDGCDFLTTRLIFLRNSGHPKAKHNRKMMCMNQLRKQRKNSLHFTCDGKGKTVHLSEK
jgi:hypothetical protein